MKLRIKGNTVRFRLSKCEVADFAEQNIISETTNFVDTKFNYCLVADPKLTYIEVSFIESNLTIKLPLETAKQWTDSNEVGIYFNISSSEGKNLQLTIEKDFKCLDETIEDQSDNYENPLASKN